MIFFFLLVHNLGGSHPTHATIRSRKTRQRRMPRSRKNLTNSSDLNSPPLSVRRHFNFRPVWFLTIARAQPLRFYPHACPLPEPHSSGMWLQRSPFSLRPGHPTRLPPRPVVVPFGSGSLRESGGNRRGYGLGERRIPNKASKE